MNKNNNRAANHSKNLLLGVAIGDAIGVPIEFMSRPHLDANPMTDITGWGTHEQPPGTFSDDTSLTLCLAESMAEGLDIEQLGKKMCDWYRKGYWSADGDVFDIGIGTRIALQKILNGSPAVLAGGNTDMDNGNGSLMRIAPLALDKAYQDRVLLWNTIQAVSSITHRHVRSHLACFIWVVFLQELMECMDKQEAYEKMKHIVNAFFDHHTIESKERELFSRVLENDIQQVNRNDINSGGYVLETLEAAFGCFLNTDSYKEAILAGVNLGRDTDTTAAVVGAAAGTYYGHEQIPSHWLDALTRRNDIVTLAEKLHSSLTS
jgi:ADP-ribosyl-[dinitrogen reductase] hydrolase